MAVLSVAGVSPPAAHLKRLGSSPDVTHAPRELLTSTNIVADIYNLCNKKVNQAMHQHILHEATQ